MRRICLLLVFVIAFATKAISQTNVSGGIYTNTTWTKANSPYIVTDTVVVFPNVTLTIEPGVVVKFDNNMRLEVQTQGSLNATGTSIDSITFTSNLISPLPGAWAGIYFGNHSKYSKFDYCNIMYADKGLHTHYTYDTVTIKHSTFSYNNIGVGWTYHTVVIIDSCLFENNVNGIKYATTKIIMTNSIVRNNQNGIISPENSTYHHCTIEFNSALGIEMASNTTVIDCSINNNGIGLQNKYGGGGSMVSQNRIENNNVGITLFMFGDSIFCNKICNNTTYDLQNSIPHHYAASVSSNYWCTNDSSVVSSKVYDGYDDVNFALINFMPIDTVQCYFTGCNVSISTTVTNATCDTCHNGSATAALTSATSPVTYTWNSSPLQTTQTATGLAPGNYTVCVIDANGCTACHTVFVDSSNCSGFSVAAQATNSTCSTCSDGSAQVSVTGGAAPYSYTWYTTPIQTTANAVGLPQGFYPVCVTDAYGCVACDTATVSVGSCSAYFNLYPDSVPHTYYAVNMASGNGALTYLWSWGDGTTDTGAYPNHVYATSGFYTICLTITDAAGCTDTYCNSFYLQRNTNNMVYVNVVGALPTGISHHEEAALPFEMFPNPANDVVSVIVDEQLIGAVLTVTDMTGRNVAIMNIEHRMSNVEVKDFSAGIYFVTISTPSGVTATKKLVIGR